MKKIFFLMMFFTIALSAGVISCESRSRKAKEVKSEVVKENKGHAHDEWSYVGETAPEHWAELERGANCDGVYQSPINIIDVNTKSLEKLDDFKIHYSSETILNKVINNGHTIEFDFEEGDSISFKNEIYHLKQLHFHVHSEHKVNGVIYPIEIHFVHVNKGGDILVLGVFGVEGEENQYIESFETYLPLANGEEKEINVSKDLNLIIPKDKSLYYYRGSLTTPPCSEKVSWLVFKNPVELSLGEVLKLKHDMPAGNYRNEQPLNGRMVYSVNL